ncbi:hypothetical protein [Sphingomonas sp. C3-2]|uniref:hypothetical protein n=1 Tax=Sphingomonas sp. C3-2 TaxID=3062169 RepID=UPI00294B6447|nr:hypothetical protein [Sphingomonas sp. C3-2]WOK35529.1 hypothetical protein QYC26_10955 [Sphingomonas sp. C3-2]
MSDVDLLQQNCLLQLSPIRGYNRYSENNFLKNSNISEKIYNLLGRNNGIGTIAAEFPENLSVLTDATLSEVHKHGLPHIVGLSGESSGFAITRDFRSALKTLQIETQEFYPLKFYAPHDHENSPYIASNRTLVGEGFFWKPLDIIDIIDFYALTDKVYHDGDGVPGQGKYYEKVDPRWLAGSFTVGKPVAIKSEADIAHPVFSVRGLRGVFIAAPFFRMMRDNEFLKYHPLKVRYLDPDRNSALRKNSIDARIAGKAFDPMPNLYFVGTAMRAPDDHDWQAKLSGI